MRTSLRGHISSWPTSLAAPGRNPRRSRSPLVRGLARLAFVLPLASMIIGCSTNVGDTAANVILNIELFERQSKDYKNSVLPPRVTARVAVEQASTLGWERYVGAEGTCIGMDTFGASAPIQALQEKFGFTVDRVVAESRAQLDRSYQASRTGAV